MGNLYIYNNYLSIYLLSILKIYQSLESSSNDTLCKWSGMSWYLQVSQPPKLQHTQPNVSTSLITLRVTKAILKKNGSSGICLIIRSKYNQPRVNAPNSIGFPSPDDFLKVVYPQTQLQGYHSNDPNNSNRCKASILSMPLVKITCRFVRHYKFWWWKLDGFYHWLPYTYVITDISTTWNRCGILYFANYSNSAYLIPYHMGPSQTGGG